MKLISNSFFGVLCLFLNGCISIGHYERDMREAKLLGEAEMLEKAIKYQTQDLTDEERLQLLKMEIAILRLKNVGH
jgi:hypothetical protein